MNTERVFVGTGSNLGDKSSNINLSLHMLQELPGVRIKAVSPFYRTAPLGYTKQDWFINAVAELSTRMEPGVLLAQLLCIEGALGRVRTIRWGPRLVDLDLLLYGQRQISKPGLEIPHPRMLERAFVMVPLADLAPEMVLFNGQRAAELAAALAAEQDIERWPAGSG